MRKFNIPSKNTPVTLALGPLMIDVAGESLSLVECERLQHPLVGMVILFARNYKNKKQLMDLVKQIKSIREPALTIAVDQEGGRVQRFREQFTQLPAVAAIGKRYDENREQGLQLAEYAGRVMAAEIRSMGIDMSFAPVLDIGNPESEVIGDRSFHRDPNAVSQLAYAYMQGMSSVGMVATGKHFPGHGGVKEDSHLELPVDERTLKQLEENDLIPFRYLISKGLPALMTAHITFPLIDDLPPTFSCKWLTSILRERYGFQGVIFSDDLSMAGAGCGGDAVQRAKNALNAGCDRLIVCNDEEAVDAILDHVSVPKAHDKHSLSLAGNFPDPVELMKTATWNKQVREVEALVA